MAKTKSKHKKQTGVASVVVDKSVHLTPDKTAEKRLACVECNTPVTEEESKGERCPHCLARGSHPEENIWAGFAHPYVTAKAE